jgi:hypothetical protein
MQANSLDNIHPIVGLAPAADAFAATVTSDVVSMKKCSRMDFIVYRGVGTTGESTITVEACDDVTPSNTTAIPFKYRTNVATDVWGAWTDAAAAGFVTAAGSNFMFQIAVRDQALPAGKPFVRLKAAEAVDSAVLGGIMIIASEDRQEHDAPVSKIA